MGITSQNELGYGSYDGSGVEQYYEFGPEVTREESQTAIRTAVIEYLHGERSLGFFVQKTVCQWCDPWFNSAVMTVYLWNTSVPISDHYRTFMQGSMMQAIEKWLSLYVLTCYLAGFLFIGISIYQCRWNPGATLMLLYFIGGFTFQLLWETKGRYCYPYFMMLIPLFSYMMIAIADLIQPRLTRHIHA